MKASRRLDNQALWKSVSLTLPPSLQSFYNRLTQEFIAKRTTKALSKCSRSDNWLKATETNTLPEHSSFHPSVKTHMPPNKLIHSQSTATAVWWRPQRYRMQYSRALPAEHHSSQKLSIFCNHWSDLHNLASPNTIPHISRQTAEPTHKKGVCNNSKPRASPDYSALNGSWAIFHILLSLKTPKKRKRNHSNSQTNLKYKILSLLYLEPKLELF